MSDLWRYTLIGDNCVTTNQVIDRRQWCRHKSIYRSVTMGSPQSKLIKIVLGDNCVATKQLMKIVLGDNCVATKTEMISVSLYIKCIIMF